jgi:hypothetical protein
MARIAHKVRALLAAALLFQATPAAAGYVDSLYGPPTAAEVAATAAWFKANPYTPSGTNQGNNLAYGTGAQRASRMASLYAMTRDVYFLDQMIRFSDHILSVRNDNFDRRILWTGKVEPAWPNKAVTAGDAAYTGTENGYVLGHLMAPAAAIARRPEIWNLDVGVGDPWGYGRTYIERARRFLFEANRTYDELLIPYFVDPVTLRLRLPTHPGWAALPGNYAKDQGHGVPWNQQDMVTSGLRNTADMLIALGEDPDRVQRYDAITRASMAWFMSELDQFQFVKNGYWVYRWGYPPGGAVKYPEDLSHASADINHLYSCYKLGRFGVARKYLEGVGNTFMEVILLPNGTFAGKVSGGGTPRTSVSTSWSKFSQFRAGIYEVQFQQDELDAAQTNAEAALGILGQRRELFELGEPPTPTPSVTPTNPPTPTPTPTPTATGTPTPDPSLGLNLALGKPASASTNWSSSFNAPKAWDGVDSTRWSASAASATNQWLGVDLGAPTAFNCVVMKEINFKRVTSHVLQRSDDGITYEDIPGTPGTTIGAKKTICFDTQSARHVRLFMHEAKQSGALKEPTINEVAVYYQQRPPAVTVPEDIVAEATGPAGAAVTFEVSATDDKDGVLVAAASPVSGSVFPLGSTTVNVTATDSDGNVGQAAFEITVVDTTPPVLTVPADIVAEASSAAGAVVQFTATAHDLVSGSVPAVADFPPGSTFPLGRTVVTVAAADETENSATATFVVTVADTTAPTIVRLAASPDVVWPPNHKMRWVDLCVHVAEAVDAAPVTRIIGVASNEPEHGADDADTAPDWRIRGDLALEVRAERAGGGSGRVYTITVESRDRFGNASTATVDVVVPHDRGQGRPGFK